MYLAGYAAQNRVSPCESAFLYDLFGCGYRVSRQIRYAKIDHGFSRFGVVFQTLHRLMGNRVEAAKPYHEAHFAAIAGRIEPVCSLDSLLLAGSSSGKPIQQGGLQSLGSEAIPPLFFLLRYNSIWRTSINAYSSTSVANIRCPIPRICALENTLPIRFFGPIGYIESRIFPIPDSGWGSNRWSPAVYPCKLGGHPHHIAQIDWFFNFDFANLLKRYPVIATVDDGLHHRAEAAIGIGDPVEIHCRLILPDIAGADSND